MPRPIRAVFVLAALALTVAGAARAVPGDTASVPDTVARDSARLAPDGDSLAAVAESLQVGREALEALVQAPSPSLAESAGTTPARAVPVFLGGSEILRVRVGRDGLDPAQRAAAIRARLNAAVADREVPVDSVALTPVADGILVRLGPHPLWMITAADVEGLDPAEIAGIMSDLPERVRGGIEKERRSRTPLRVLLSLGIVLVVTFAGWILAIVLLRGFARYRTWLRGVLPRFLPPIRLRTFEVLSREQLVEVAHSVLSRVDVVVFVLLGYWYLTGLLSLFPWTQGWSWALLSFARTETLRLLGGLGAAVPGLFIIAVIFTVARWLAGLSDRFFDAIGSGALTIGSFHPELARPSRRLVRIGLVIVAVMIAYPYIPGSQSRAVQGVSILLGLMVSLGSTGFVGNAISGIVLTFSRSFSVGERVRIGDHVGDVMTLGFFATKLRTIYDEEVTIPNGQVAATSIVNYSRLAPGPGLSLHTEVTIGYDAPWRRVHALLVEAAGRVGGIEKEPAPRVFQRALNDHTVTYELTCVTRDALDQRRLYSDLHAEIQDAFARAGLEILSPTYHAVRDANAPVLPAEPAGPRDAPGGFRVRGGS